MNIWYRYFLQWGERGPSKDNPPGWIVVWDSYSNKNTSFHFLPWYSGTICITSRCGAFYCLLTLFLFSGNIFPLPLFLQLLGWGNWSVQPTFQHRWRHTWNLYTSTQAFFCYFLLTSTSWANTAWKTVTVSG